MLGVLALLPPAMNAAQLSWALVAATALTHAPAFMVAALASQEPVEEVRFKGTEGSSSLEISHQMWRPCVAQVRLTLPYPYSSSSARSVGRY